jgi:hypothetical protein
VRFYPDIAAPRAAAILSDLLILVLLVLLAWLGLNVHDAVAELASVPRGVIDGGSAIQRGFESAGDAVGPKPSSPPSRSSSRRSRRGSVKGGPAGPSRAGRGAVPLTGSRGDA